MEPTNKTSRRKFLENTAAIGAIGAIGVSQLVKSCSTGTRQGKVVVPEFLRSAPDGEPLKAGVIGCGGRGSGAAVNFLDAGPSLSITAIGDLFQDRIDDIRKKLKEEKGVELDDSMCFTGFDAYKKVIESGVDLVILATPPYFRPEHFQACVEARKHVFMEKPVAVDPVGARAVMAASKQAEAAGLSVVTGTQRRHSWNYQNVLARARAGMIGDITSANVYWNQSRLWHREKQAGWTDMEYMIRDWVNWTWLSGDHIVEQHIHNIDVSNWFIGKQPLKAVGVGSRQRRITGDCYDNFSVDFVYENEVHMHSMCRQIDDCANNVSEFLRGTKGYTNCGKTVWDQEGNILYEYNSLLDEQGEPTDIDDYVQEHIDLVNAIRTGNQIVEAEETAKSCLTAIMGRESAYTGREITWEEMMGSGLKLGPEGELSFGPVDIKAVIPVPGSAPV
jgi:myo-inositol 2-dehydrogenase/D-chiro-inositol 1-dehydrogenase